MYDNRKGIKFGQLLSPETALNIHENIVSRQVKLGNLQLSIRRGQSNLSIVFISVGCEEKDYYCVVSVGQLGFVAVCKDLRFLNFRK